jgi:mRNA-degrading endonuclease RelE of RelBE toxin-antitoxin system
VTFSLELEYRRGSCVAYRIAITKEADRQLHALPVRDQRKLEAAIVSRLRYQPTVPTKAIKRLRSNPLAEFELRVGSLRVLYNVEQDEVILLIIGRKVGNKLIVEGEEFHGHQDHTIEPSGNGAGKDTE